ncbi:MAG: hypothetical protein ACRBDI_05420 [Alphaproteobacteria bacterium]
MSLYIIAQATGFLGYIFYISAPHFKTQIRIMQVGLIGYVFLCAQWYMLGQYSLLTLNMLSIVTSVMALYAVGDARVRRAMYFLYPFGAALILLTSSGTVIDGLALVAFVLSLRSKMSENILEFRGFAFVAGGILTCTGSLALSVPAMIFNFLFAAAHAKNLDWSAVIRVFRKSQISA